MKQNTTKAPMIKGRAYNQIQRYFQPKDIKSKLSDQQKFEEISEIMKDSVREMRNYKTDKRNKKKVNKLRAERGYKPKKKISKEEYLKSQRIFG